MKQLKHPLIFWLVGVLLMSFVWNQNLNEQIINALKLGNASALATFFDQEIDLSLNGNTEVVKKEEAAKKLDGFFKSNPPNQFQLLHQGKSAKGLAYAIGKLNCGSKEFRVSIYTRDVNGKQSIQQLSIEDN